MSENATAYELAHHAHEMLRHIVAKKHMPLAYCRTATEMVAQWDEFKAAHGIGLCDTCQGRGVASDWVKCATGAEEHLDFPCHCPAGKAIEAELAARGKAWTL